MNDLRSEVDEFRGIVKVSGSDITDGKIKLPR